jgi:hypothetical protein
VRRNLHWANLAITRAESLRKLSQSVEGFLAHWDLGTQRPGSIGWSAGSIANLGLQTPLKQSRHSGSAKRSSADLRHSTSHFGPEQPCNFLRVLCHR